MKAQGFSWRKEIIAGITTFLAISYIIPVHPHILSDAQTGMSFHGVLTATILLCFLMTFLMGVYAKLPIAVAPGMGINTFFATTLIKNQHIPWQTALGMVFWSGIFFILISVTPLRSSLARAIPLQLRVASTVGMGLFLTFIGVQKLGLIGPHPDTLLTWIPMQKNAIWAIVGLFLAILLWGKKSPFAFLVSIVVPILGAWIQGQLTPPASFVSLPDFHSVFFRLDPWAALKWSLVPSIISLVFTDFFDSISTFIGVAQSTKLVDEKGEPLHMRQGLLVDALSTLSAGLFGSSSGTAYLESISGIEAGGRTGRSAMITAFCFLPFLFFAPSLEMIPAYATAPILILVGMSMFRSVVELKWECIEDSIPAFLTIVLIPFTFSITQGMLWGFVSYILLYPLVGRGKEVRPMMYGVGVLSFILLAIDHLRFPF